MLKPSKKLALALEAVVDIAFNGGAEPVQSHDIARRLGLPRRYLEQVLQQLVRQSILKGVRGPRGGYRLARERRRVSVGEVIRVLQGVEEQQQDDCLLPSESELGTKVIAPFWDQVAQDVMIHLDQVSIEDLCREAEGRSVVTQSRGALDFAI